MFIVRHKTFFLVLTLLMVLASSYVVYRYGFKYSIEFTGGSIVEVRYSGVKPDLAMLRGNLDKLGFGQYVMQPVGSDAVSVRMKNLAGSEHAQVLGALAMPTGSATETRFDSIGPVVGSEMRTKSIWAIGLVIVFIVLYITFAFRHVSRPVPSWKYGVTAILALAHDVVVPSAFYIIYGRLTGVEVDVLFVTAILAILGFSVHDTIVVFDRIRENLRLADNKATFNDTVGKSINQTFTRSINTSLTVVLVLLALYFIGSVTTQHFALLLVVGVIMGTYSSIFIASPLLIMLKGMQDRRLLKRGGK